MEKTNNNNSSVLLEIKSHYPQMNDAMRRIADYVVSSDHYSVYLTAAELAGASGVSTASVSRFVRSLGCRDFDEFRFKMLLEQQEQKEQRFSDNNTLSYNGETINGTAQEICKIIFSKSIHEIVETWNMIDVDQLEKIADSLEKARRIIVIAVGRSKLTAEALFSRLYRIGYPIFLFSDAHEIVNITSIMETQKLLDDIDININPKAYIRDLNNGAKQMVEIIRAVSQNSRMVIMDEPTSSLSDHEVMSLFKRLHIG